VQKETYLLELARYVVLNPVRAGMVGSPDQWPWSSYRAMAGLCDAPPWLTIDGLLAAFSAQPGEARERYVAFVAAGKNQSPPWEQLRSQIFLGSEAYIASLQQRIDADAPLQEIPAIQRRPQPQPKPLALLAREYERDKTIFHAYASRGYRLQEIGDHFGLHYSRVSRIVKQHWLAKDKT
jgi:hypothetical protein